MHHVLLVEDEHIIRNGLIRNINWAKHGFEVVASAEDGEEGWQKFCTFRPDVVITDIKMPESNGLDLLKKIKTAAPDVFVLLLSGYEDFEFARTGLQYGAYEYISKLSVMDTIDDTLHRLSEALNKKKKLEIEQKALQGTANEHMLELMIRGEPPISLLEGIYYVSMVVICGQMLSVCDMPDNILQITKDNLTLFLVRLQNNHPYPVKHILQCIGEDADHCGISGVFPAKQAVACFFSALRDLDIKVLNKYYSVDDAIPVHVYADMITMENYDDIPRAFSAESLRRIRHNDMTLLKYHRYCHEQLSLLFALDTTNPEYMDSEAMSTVLYRFFSMIDMRQWTQDVIDRFCQAALFRKREIHLDDMAKALMFIDNHFHENIDASQIARYLHLTPQHFSTKFKSKVGESFSSYLRKKRLQKACDLLARTDFSMNEIATAIGYQDEKYFYRVFRSEMHMSPNYYRKVHPHKPENKDNQ